MDLRLVVGVGELNLILYNHGAGDKSYPFSGSTENWYIIKNFIRFYKNKNKDGDIAQADVAQLVECTERLQV